MNILNRNLSRLTFTVSILLTSAATLATNSSEKIAQHLAESVRFKTISHQNLANFDPKPFEQHKQFLQDTYPEVFSQLEVQWVNEFSVLIKWEGSDSSLKPVLFLAHTDVVPIEPGTEARHRKETSILLLAMMKKLAAPMVQPPWQRYLPNKVSISNLS